MGIRIRFRLGYIRCVNGIRSEVLIVILKELTVVVVGSERSRFSCDLHFSDAVVIDCWCRSRWSVNWTFVESSSTLCRNVAKVVRY